MKKLRMRRFVLQRHEDESGVSGTGIVAEGVVFDNGYVAMTWLSHLTSCAVYPSLDVMVAIHGHDGKSEVVFLDAEEDSNG